MSLGTHRLAICICWSIKHSLLHDGLGKYREGALSLDVRREEELVEAEQQIAQLERKANQPTTVFDLLHTGSSACPR